MLLRVGILHKRVTERVCGAGNAAGIVAARIWTPRDKRSYFFSMMGLTTFFFVF